MEFKPTAPLASNKAGFRLIVFSEPSAVYPAFLVSSTTNEVSNPRCYFDGYHENTCISLALLSGPSETRNTKVREGNLASSYSSASAVNVNVKTNCKVALTKSYCLIPKTGFITNLEGTLRTAIYKNLLPVAEYEAHTTEQKNHVVEFVNNLGTKYIVSCNNACKIEQNFNFFKL